MIIKVKSISPNIQLEADEQTENTLSSSHFFPFFRFQDENGKEIVGSCVFTSKGRILIQQEDTWYEVCQ
ncbi:MAG: hypothetical protein AAB868_00435 [Patescibacteria group bacterium]